MPHAILLDTISIQDYIFNSNKLKYNTGASYIIEYELFSKNLINGKTTESSLDYEIGYSGGGNLLLIFKNSTANSILQFVYTYSKHILMTYPGVQLAFGIIDDFNDQNYKENFQKLLQSLQANKGKQLSISNVFKQGITADCPVTNKAAEWGKKDHEKWVSGEAYSKILHAEKATEKLNADYSEILIGKYAFPSELEDLGQPEDSGYIAIVHADGNGIGKMFSEIQSLEDVRVLSQKMKKAAKEAFKNFLTALVQALEANPLMIDLKRSERNNLKYLPVRPILMGGDDVTFVCEGRIALWCAETYISCFTHQFEEQDKISMCAGIAIVKTKYPFFRAYHLSEELLKEAKNKHRGAPGDYISFYISASGNKDSLEEIRQANSKYKGPYKMEYPGLQSLKNQIKYYSKEWNRNKLMQLREVIFKDEQNQKYFLQELAVKDIRLHSLADEKNLDAEFDAIELTEFYPKQLL